MKRIIFLLIGVIFLSALIIFWQSTRTEKNNKTNKLSLLSPTTKKTTESSITVLAENLTIPWSLNFLPDGRIIFTERPGRVKILNPGNTEQKTVIDLEDVFHIGEGGLLGLSLHPDFKNNNFLYLYYTYQQNGTLFNRVVRYKFGNDLLSDRKIIIENIPGSSNHDGGRIKFGPDGMLYITTGDAQNSGLAQNKNSLAGKILRIKDDGSIPENNPFPNSRIFSLGHRNPQGITWDSNGNLWATEHGPSAQDELNKIERGKNYGWPIITGNETQNGLESPVLTSGQDTWAPTGVIFFDQSLYFGGLRGEGIYKVSNLENNPKLEKFFDKEFGRIRDIIVGPDNMFYLIVNNTDGRGNPKPNDDKIIKLSPSLF